MKIFAAYGGPPIIKGLVRDIRPIWALEEIGAEYEISWLDVRQGEQRSDAYRKLHPFGKVPVMQDGDVTMFESGAICLYIANKYGALGGPSGSAAWNDVLQWSFAALDTVLPSLFNHFVWANFMSENDASPAVCADAVETSAARLDVLERELTSRDYIAGSELTVADILLGASLRNGLQPDVLGERPHLRSYLDRLFERPAFCRAFNLNLAGPNANAAE